MAHQFLLDVMLGKLVTYLRMCGYDSQYALEEGLEADEAIQEQTETTDRILVTRDRVLATQTDDAVLLTSRDIESQLAELQAHGFEIELSTHPKRCSVCNGCLNRTEQRPEHAPDGLENVWQCVECDHYFWKGSHWERVQETIDTIPA
jgi:hypothetical protein